MTNKEAAIVLKQYVSNNFKISGLYAFLHPTINPDKRKTHIGFILTDEAHDKEAEKYSVITGTNTYQTKRGCEAVDECYDIFQNILSMMQNNYQDKNALSYKYIAYHQDIINSVSDYMTARDDTFGIEDNGKESE